MSLKEEYFLTDNLRAQLENTPESGMNYRIVRVKTKTGECFENVIVVGGYRINGIYGYKEMPFTIEDITNIEVTHLQKPPDFDPKKWFYVAK